MSDEIKEILELFKEYASGGMSGLYPPEETIKNLLDYITNLQTIEREYSSLLSENAELQQENDDYKSRCEKAIEYINKHSNMSGTFDGKKFYVENIGEVDSGYNLLKILKGGLNE